MNAKTEALGPRASPGSEGPLRHPLLRHVGHTPGNPFRSKPGGHSIEHRSDLVTLANAGCIDCRDGQPASAAFLDKFLLLEQLQGMADRRARHAKHPAELFLADTPAGGERTIRYRLDQTLIGAVDQRRFGVERLQQSTCNSEFTVLRYPVSNTPSNNDAATARKKDQHLLGS